VAGGAVGGTGIVVAVGGVVSGVFDGPGSDVYENRDLQQDTSARETKKIHINKNEHLHSAPKLAIVDVIALALVEVQVTRPTERSTAHRTARKEWPRAHDARENIHVPGCHNRGRRGRRSKKQGAKAHLQEPHFLNVRVLLPALSLNQKNNMCVRCLSEPDHLDELEHHRKLNFTVARGNSA